MHYSSFKPSLLVLVVFLVFSMQCQSPKKHEAQNLEAGSFGYEAGFLSKYEKTVVLQSDDGKAKVLVCPAYQGRVMTSSANGDEGKSYGWLNHQLIASGKKLPKMNAFGGEDRFWVGPEGGQFSVFFKPGTEFDFQHWATPAVLDTQPFDLVSSDGKKAVFSRDFQLENYSKTMLKVHVDRTVALLNNQQIENVLGVPLDSGVQVVGFHTENEITNTGNEPWTKASGALSIWILGMFNPTPATTIVVPFHPGAEEDLGPVLNDAYFGKVPDDRLIVGDSVIFFKADGKQRGKIGLSPYRATSFMGSYDEQDKVLTIVHCTEHEGNHDYVNSMWHLQDKPFGGDMANAYNDGPVDGQVMGPFYEMESSSPAAFLKPGEKMEHEQVTIHLQGDQDELDKISRKVLGVELDKIARAF